MKNKPKVDNKWVEDRKKEAKALADNLEVLYGKRSCNICGCFPERQIEQIEALIDKTQQETLEEVRSYVDGIRNPYEMPDTQKQKHAFETARYDVLSFLNDRIVKTIKKKIEETPNIKKFIKHYKKDIKSLAEDIDDRRKEIINSKQK